MFLALPIPACLVLLFVPFTLYPCCVYLVLVYLVLVASVPHFTRLCPASACLAPRLSTCTFICLLQVYMYLRGRSVHFTRLCLPCLAVCTFYLVPCTLVPIYACCKCSSLYPSLESRALPPCTPIEHLSACQASRTFWPRHLNIATLSTAILGQIFRQIQSPS